LRLAEELKDGKSIGISHYLGILLDFASFCMLCIDSFINALHIKLIDTLDLSLDRLESLLLSLPAACRAYVIRRVTEVSERAWTHVRAEFPLRLVQGGQEIVNADLLAYVSCDGFVFTIYFLFYAIVFC
jgi:hypothetical protein